MQDIQTWLPTILNIITLFSVVIKVSKNTLTKEDLEDTLKSVNDKFKMHDTAINKHTEVLDRYSEEFCKFRERLAVIEFKLGEK